MLKVRNVHRYPPATMGGAVHRREVVVYPQMLAAGLRAASSPPSVDPLTAACGSTNPGIACRLVWDLTHSTKAADLTRVYLAGPAQLAIRVGFVILIALVIRFAAHRAIRKISASAAKETANGSDRAHLLLFRERRQQRATALGTVLSNAASLAIFGIAAVIILGDLGLNLAPLLASTAVLGVALGFGAQNLVQDFLAGVFMLVEDQYGVGDVIDVGGTSGTVEAVSLRITRMRDVSGVVWHVRNGTITKAGNKSQGWARAVVDFPIAYRHDIPQVRELMAQTATAMWQEPEWHDIILEEPEVWGVQTLYTDAVLLRVVARTVPLRQWEVQRELTERLKTALDASGLAAGPDVISGAEAATGDVGDPAVPTGVQPLAAPSSPVTSPPSPATVQGTLGDAVAAERSPAAR
jgi:moderate conductance mechanosensitive channel